MAYVNFADGWMQTVDLWYRKWSLVPTEPQQLVYVVFITVKYHISEH